MPETGEPNSVAAIPPKATRPRVAVRPWVGCLASVLLALACLCPTWTVLWLALRGELVLNAGEPGEVRIWLARSEAGSALAVSTARAVRVASGQACLQSRVRFLPLAISARPAPAHYCSCTGPDGEATFRRGTCQP